MQRSWQILTKELIDIGILDSWVQKDFAPVSTTEQAVTSIHKDLILFHYQIVFREYGNII